MTAPLLSWVEIVGYHVRQMDGSYSVQSVLSLHWLERLVGLLLYC